MIPFSMIDGISLAPLVEAKPIQNSKSRQEKASTKRNEKKRSRKKRPSKRKKRSRKKRPSKREPDLSLARLRKAFRRTLNKKPLKDAKVGYVIRDLNSGVTLLSHRANTLFHPASNTKLITTSAAYKVLGPEQRLVTRWYIDDDSKDKGTILYWRASGDPKIVPETFEMVAKEVKKALIKKGKRLKINRLVIDDRDFTSNYLAPGYDQKPKDDAAYRSPNGGVGFQFNRFTTSLEPGKRVGDSPKVNVNPPLKYFKIINRGKTSRKGKERLQLSAQESASNQSMLVTIGGTIPRRHKRVSTARRIGNPVQFAGQSLLYYLSKVGIKVSSQVSLGKVPRQLFPIVTHKSPKLSSLIKDINVYSNNFMAEQLLLLMGLGVRGIGNWEAGKLVVKSYLDAVVGIEGYTYVNGSGLFGDTRFSPQMITEVLLSVHHESNGLFRSLLPLAGREGTLRKRLRKLPRGSFNGKTGTLDQVSTLCGYLTTRAKRELVLCLFMNDYQVKTWAIRSAQDEMVSYAWLLKDSSLFTLKDKVTPDIRKSIRKSENSNGHTLR